MPAAFGAAPYGGAVLAHPRRGSSGPPVRSLADDLRARSDAELAELLAARPDLSRPLPGDLTALAARAATPASLSRAVDALDAGALSVLHALVGAGDPVQEAQLRRDLGLTAAALRAAVTDLWRVALVWRGGDGWHVPRGVADILGPSQAPAVVLDQPPLPAREVGPEPVDSAAGAATADLLEMVDELADLWGPTPPRVLRAGGLAVADLISIDGNILTIRHIDCFDGTPLIDIKPYFASTDSKPEAEVGWRKKELTPQS